jgi:uncharacterized UBP type Zn finger protein
MEGTCTDLEKLGEPRRTAVKPSGAGCKECLEAGGEWVHLRLCMTCGHVGCCDSSPGQHATKHHKDSDHPVMRTYEPGENWRWCFVDHVLV